MRIACVGTEWYPLCSGGLEKYVYGLTRALAAAGDEVDLFVTGASGVSDPLVALHSIATPGESLWKRMRDARHAFRSQFHGEYDVLNLHFAMNALPLIPFIDHRIPRVVHFHGPWAAEGRAEGGGEVGVRVKWLLEQFVYRRADRFIVLSTAFADILESYGVKRGRISVVPMGIDCALFAPASNRTAVREALRWPADIPVFFAARRLVHRVGLVELLRAAAIARDRGARFLLKIAGKGALRPALEEEIRSLRLGDVVELLGFVSEEDLVRAYQSADATIVPSQALEGFGTTISESLACGTPVLVTPVGGMPEAVEPLCRELVTRSASPQDLALAMLAFVDGALPVPARERCREYAQEQFDWRTIAGSVRDIFLETTCVGRERPRHSRHAV